MHFGNNNERKDYFLNTEAGPQLITEVEEETDLGITFDNKLKFERHITNKINKANQSVGIIKKNFKHLDSDILVLLYKALVRPHLEYGQAIWYPHQMNQSKSIEKVQRRATKTIKEISHLSYDERLKVLGLPSLKYRRLRGDLIIVYGIIQKGEHDRFFKFHGPDSTTRGHGLKMYKDQSNTNSKKFSFSNRVITTWNQLPEAIVKATSLNQFKNLLDRQLSNLKYKYD